MNQKEELIKRLEVRKKQLLGEIKPSYKITEGHHLRDVFTMLAYLKGDEKVEGLIKNLPEIPK